MIGKSVGLVSVMFMLTIGILGLASDTQAVLINVFVPKIGSLICDITASQIGNPNEPKGFKCQGEKLPEATVFNIIVLCGTPGNLHAAAGVNSFAFNGTFSGFETIDPASCDKKRNKCSGSPHGQLTPEQLQGLTAAGACPNPNWTALDAAPCEGIFTADVVALDCAGQEVVLAEQKIRCTMDLQKCANIQVDQATTTFVDTPYDSCQLVSNESLPKC